MLLVPIGVGVGIGIGIDSDCVLRLVLTHCVAPFVRMNLLTLVEWITTVCFYFSRRERQERQEYAHLSTAPAFLYQHEGVREQIT
jgi:hypothetical protein